jgi:hypothetical protein
MPVITKVMYRDCGLILASFRGYIELFDRMDFNLKGVWDNQVSKSDGLGDPKSKKPALKKANSLLEIKKM